MPTSKLMQKLKKEHKKQVKKFKPGARNATNVKPTPKRVSSPTPAPKKNLTVAVAKMKATEAKLKANKNKRSIKIISK
jgi:hypothetical protein